MNFEMKIKTALFTIFLIGFLNLIDSSKSTAADLVNTENIFGRLTAVQCDSLVTANHFNPNFVILDVRTESEWQQQHLQGSIFISTGDPDFEFKVDALPKHKTYLLHCRSGGRSAGAFALMKKLQFAEVYEMIGGIISWNENGLPVTNEVSPRLMLVSYSEIKSGMNSDTIEITVTNRANGNLNFTDFYISDYHDLEHNFFTETVLAGAEDYTFSIIHSPLYEVNDSTKINIDSNGGLLSFKVGSRSVSTNINNQWEDNLVLYPNPAKQFLYLRNIESTVLDEISVINIAGQKVLNQTFFSTSNGIDVSNLKDGIYFIRIKKGRQFTIHKFIVKN
jgi:rhodanese-related sulfurtransferase